MGDLAGAGTVSDLFYPLYPLLSILILSTMKSPLTAADTEEFVGLHTYDGN